MGIMVVNCYARAKFEAAVEREYNRLKGINDAEAARLAAEKAEAERVAAEAEEEAA